MPWLETVPVEQRERFIDDHRLGLYDMTELCARYAISGVGAGILRLGVERPGFARSGWEVAPTSRLRG